MGLRLQTLLLAALAAGVCGQSDVSGASTATTGATDTDTTTEAATPTGTYQTFTSQITVGSTTSRASGASGASTDVESQVVVTSGTSETVLYLTGSAATTLAGNFSATRTSASATPTVTNTRPCNNYPEFCSRKYSNITEIACHNSPFTTKNNLAANQEYSVKDQLDDGVRFLQAQIQWPTNGTEPHFCHTSCDILDAGPITDWLTSVKEWVADNPYDVVTILLGNGNYSAPSMYVPYIESTGILNYIYTPSLIPMTLNDWPTLSEMILTGGRVVMFLDYMANQTQYPWFMDEFSQLWETPFDPTNQTFPCTAQRPPDLADDDARNRMYLHNHNLNLELSLLGTSMLVPARTYLNTTNDNGTAYGTLGLAAENCAADWGRAPNFLNVDYYNSGGFPGSVFEVAAKYNNVTYDRTCCGMGTSAGSRTAVGGLDSNSLAWTVSLAVGVSFFQALSV